ncbi:hypothetical protein J8L88_04510 [Aquimarina sp. MMG015]|uniref:hypothetical protein n=1 Tax=Aquimarina sp. MMG015 TaxID=2822689 RepID=UPI001B3A48CC|nr:hypothetical protein [Aquimarina sp. MMG015]MBQ4802107.1 hypothetical protein [Aquimarina sp. MMG015]
MKNKILVLICIFIMKSLFAISLYADVVIDTTTVINNTETYQIYTDEVYVYLTIETIDSKVATSILRQGINVYFDTKGKKKKNVFITYPIANNQRPPRRNKDRPNETREFPDNDSIIRQIGYRLKNNTPQKALYQYYDKTKEFNTLLNNEGITINLAVNEERNSFIYYLKIPNNKINVKSGINFNKLSIGVKTVEMSRDNSERTRPTQQASVRGGGRRGGGRSNGGAPQGRSGNGPGGGDQGRSKGRKTESVPAIDFWFKTTSK